MNRPTDTQAEDLATIWNGVRDELRGTLPQSAFENWLEPLRAVGVQGSRLYVSGPDRVRDWFQRRYGAAATDALRRRAPGFTEIAFADPPADAAGARIRRRPTQDPLERPIPAGLADGLDFDRFVIGSGNRFAHSAALAVAESPGESYNPLFLYGQPGLGKTHLLVSIANYLRRQRPDLPVVYTTAERFTSEFVTSLRGDGRPTERFKKRYRGVGALLIDDVQFLEGKAKTEDEFFHTFNELYAQGSQIVLSSDRPPEAMSRLSERMRDRFAWGLTVEIQGPDPATRIALLKRLAAENGIPVPDVDVLQQIALAAPENLRRLEGALTRVTAFASMLGEVPSVDLVRKALGSRGRRRRPRPASARRPTSSSSASRPPSATSSTSPAPTSAHPAAPPTSSAAGNSPCTSPATRPTSPSPRSPAASSATTRPSSTPSAGWSATSSPAPISTRRSSESTNGSISMASPRDGQGAFHDSGLVHGGTHNPRSRSTSAIATF